MRSQKRLGGSVRCDKTVKRPQSHLIPAKPLHGRTHAFAAPADRASLAETGCPAFHRTFFIFFCLLVDEYV